jgi:broad specificity phosphatase PhoE
VSDPRILFLIRHGRSDLSSNDYRTTPRGNTYDPPLDDAGREQADLLAARLLLMDPQPIAVYCSPFRRAVETVEPFASRTGIAVTYEEELGEAFIGEWENVPFEEIIAGDEQMLRRFRDQDDIWRHAPGAEAVESFRSRVKGAIEGVLDRHTEGNIEVVAHGGVINT